MNSKQGVLTIVALTILAGCEQSPTRPVAASHGASQPLAATAAANPAIAFDPDTSIWVMNADGSNAARVVASAQFGRWAPFGDGSAANPYALVYNLRGSTCTLATANVTLVNGVATGSNYRTLTTPYSKCILETAAWSPLGDTIAFITYPEYGAPSALWLVPAGGGSPVEIYPAPPAKKLLWTAWRSDASEIAVAEVDSATGLQGSIQVINRATGAVTTVLSAGTIQAPRGLDWARTKDVLTFAGTHTCTGKSCGTPTVYVFTLDVGTGALTQIAAGVWPTWSPDDSQIAFLGTVTSRGRSSNAVQTINLATKAISTLYTGTLTNGYWPDWRR